MSLPANNNNNFHLPTVTLPIVLRVLGGRFNGTHFDICPCRGEEACICHWPLDQKIK